MIAEQFYNQNENFNIGSISNNMKSLNINKLSMDFDLDLNDFTTNTTTTNTNISDNSNCTSDANTNNNDSNSDSNNDNNNENGHIHIHNNSHSHNHIHHNSSLSVSISSTNIDTCNESDSSHLQNSYDCLNHTEFYIHDDTNQILLNNNVTRKKSNVSSISNISNNNNNNIKKTNTRESLLTNNIPFDAKKHSTILPLDEINLKRLSIQEENIIPMNKTQFNPTSAATIKSCPSTFLINNNGQQQQIGLKTSDSARKEIQKMRLSLLNKKEMKRKRKTFLIDDDRVLIGNKVSEGHVNFIIAYNMLTGIRVSVSHCSGIMKPLILQDFKAIKKLAFDYHGNESTPSSQYAFKFKDYSPQVFRELRALFGLDPADYLMSLTSKYILSELNSPGKSGSFFYYSRDYKYIIKTIHHSEHIHLRKHLREYYNHVKTNPDTLLCQYYGLHRIKMPISFENKIKHRKIYFLVMNNLFPPHLDIQKTFDIKGSTWGRYTPIPKEAKTHINSNSKDSDETNMVRLRPVLKDLNWLNSNERIRFGPIKKRRFLQQLKADVCLLAKLNIMDYSLLLGIHHMTNTTNSVLYDNDNYDDNFEPNDETCERSDMIHYNSIFPHYFKQYEGGIRSSDEFDKDGDIIYFIGIIDCLTNYSFLKKLETLWRSLSHDTKLVSAIPPKDYANRFFEFIEDSIDPLLKEKYKDNPTKKKEDGEISKFSEYHD
ncbi:hypothetical protein RI543_004242 [Arxiozyma heterogenica]|uniref:1-phosphatidylinositol-4-phosphate 5-kinase n=1 Tax=Arxiozyma heterogenica TaxID=278026 RepID=A0AAN7ZRT4_9SACH|nr:hypothetical protein RI543_004242 [Kazachstania heterogenica]